MKPLEMHDKTPQTQMTAWWQSPLGRYLDQAEKHWLQTRSAGFTGYFQLQIGGTQSILPELSRPCCQCWLDPRGQVETDPQFLPFKSDTVDQLVIQHQLEFSEQPHQLLREADRVLADDGKLILFCFNPLSLWGVKRLFSRSQNGPWTGHFFSRMRLKDWLVLLGYDVVESCAMVFQPPINHGKSLTKMQSIESIGRRCWPYFGAVSVLVAKKQSVIVTPLRSSWQQPGLFSNPLPSRTATGTFSRENKHGSH